MFSGLNRSRAETGCRFAVLMINGVAVRFEKWKSSYVNLRALCSFRKQQRVLRSWTCVQIIPPLFSNLAQ